MKMNDDSKDGLSVMICNGAVLKTNLRPTINIVFASFSRRFYLPALYMKYILQFLVRLKGNNKSKGKIENNYFMLIQGIYRVPNNPAIPKR